MQKGKALQVLMKTADTAPGTGGATFVTFDDLSINKKGDTAVIATYTNGMTTKTGVFLFTSNGIIPIVLNGDALPGTGGTEDGTVPEDIDGPWVNDNDDVAFAADHINAASSFEGSVFLKPFNQSLQALLLMGAAGRRASAAQSRASASAGRRLTIRTCCRSTPSRPRIGRFLRGRHSSWQGRRGVRQAGRLRAGHYRNF